MNIVWLRNDLRLDDNPALYHASLHPEPLLAVYCVTPGQWQLHLEAPIKLGFRSELLNSLRRQLAALGIPLVLISANTYTDLPTAMARLCQQRGARRLWMNAEIPLNEQQRDRRITELLNERGIECINLQNEFLLPPEQIKTAQGGVYRVFTPWYRAWVKQLTARSSAPLPEPAGRLATVEAGHETIWLPGASDYRRDLWPATEQTARQRLNQFVTQQMGEYEDLRDRPAINGTSTLSPYLASGVLGIRRVLQTVQLQITIDGDDWQNSPWLRELGWREFYRYLMFHFPELSKLQPFRPETHWLPREHNPENVKAWQQGLTGFPIIDAAMRQLSSTGWMHNRLRMICASFFSKLLLEHWRLGEDYFMDQLLDGDFASNNGGWQWCASTGCDASPWFRVFNPTRQSQKFDADGQFIRRFVPELTDLDSNSIHDPSPAQRLDCGYPVPIVDYRLARERVLQRFRHLSQLKNAV